MNSLNYMKQIHDKQFGLISVIRVKPTLIKIIYWDAVAGVSTATLDSANSDVPVVAGNQNWDYIDETTIADLLIDYNAIPQNESNNVASHDFNLDDWTPEGDAQ